MLIKMLISIKKKEREILFSSTLLGFFWRKKKSRLRNRMGNTVG